MSFHKFHQESFVEKLKYVFRSSGFDKPTEVEQDGDYYQVITHSSSVPIDRDAYDLLKKHDNNILSFYRMEVGEGIEKKNENFADEVMAQIKK